MYATGYGNATLQGPKHPGRRTEFPVNPEIITKNRDGRWLAEVIELPGVLTYGATKNETNPTSNQLTIE
jgi:hypothetical protein